MAKPRALFMHIPKTGGISLYRAIKHPNVKIKGHFIQNPFYLFLRDYLKSHPMYNTKIFTFVRNPWDRLVSAFFYLNKGGRNICDKLDNKHFLAKYEGNFEHFVKEGVSQGKILKQLHMIPQHQWICDYDDSVLADYVGHFEALGTELGYASEYLGIPFKTLEHKNKSSHKPYYEYYDQEMIDIVAKAYEKDIKIFNYGFR